MNATLIHNPTAGFNKLSKEEIIQVLAEKGYQTTYVSSKEDDLGEALEHPGELVIVAGGDGTVKKAALWLIGKNVPIGILPLGTANNIATTLQSCGLIELITNQWDLSNRFPYDIGKAQGSWGATYFFESVGFGALAALIPKSSDKQKKAGISFKNSHEKIQFGISLLKEIVSKGISSFYHIELDGRDYSGKYFLVEIMNIKSVGPNLKLAGNAHPGDGLFDVILLSEGEKEPFLQYANNLYHGKEDEFKLKVIRASNITLQAEQTQLHIDDEIFETEENSKVKITLEANQLVFL